MIQSAKEFVRHPITLVSAFLTSLSGLFPVPLLDPLFGVVWANIGQLFTAFSIGAFTIVPNVQLPVAQAGEALQITAIILGIAYAGKLGLGVLRDVSAKLD